MVGFGSSDHLASAYGIAVTGTLAIDTLLFFFVVRALWHKPLWLAVAGARRLPHDRPRVLRREPAEGAARRLVPGGGGGSGGGGGGAAARRSSRRCASTTTLVRVPRTGVFLTAYPDNTPLALRANVEHNHTVHETGSS